MIPAMNSAFGIKPVYTPSTFWAQVHVGWNLAPAWRVYDFRTSLVPTCPQLTTAQKVAAAAHGIIRQVNMRLVAGSGVALAEEAVPGPRWNSCDENTRIMQKNWDPSLGVYQFWLLGFDAVTDIELEVWFDIPL
jgi:hypothetical protein